MVNPSICVTLSGPLFTTYSLHREQKKHKRFPNAFNYVRATQIIKKKNTYTHAQSADRVTIFTQKAFAKYKKNKKREQ